jgi:hypothetical protein
MAARSQAAQLLGIPASATTAQVLHAHRCIPASVCLRSQLPELYTSRHHRWTPSWVPGTRRGCQVVWSTAIAIEQLLSLSLSAYATAPNPNPNPNPGHRPNPLTHSSAYRAGEGSVPHAGAQISPGPVRVRARVSCESGARRITRRWFAPQLASHPTALLDIQDTN